MCFNLLQTAVWFVYFAAASIRGRSKILRLGAVNLSMILALFAIGEIVFVAKGDTAMLGESAATQLHHPLARTAAADDGLLWPSARKGSTGNKLTLEGLGSRRRRTRRLTTP